MNWILPGNPLKFETCTNSIKLEMWEITKNISDFNKWSKPKKTVKPSRININNEATTTTSNRYASLGRHANKSSKAKYAKQQKLSSTNTSVPRNGHHYQKKHTPASSDTLIVNLSDRVLSPAEKSVLELGVSFSPLNKNYDRILFATDFYEFVRRLKLCDYFANLDSDYEQSDGYKDELPDNGVWVEKNPDWYPEKVTKNRSKGLQTFIENTRHDVKAHLSHKDQRYWNNLSFAQRQALRTLSTDKTIVTKQADKGGALVIMNRSDYEKECLSQLTNNRFYEELPSDPKMTYRKVINETVDKCTMLNSLQTLSQKKWKKEIERPVVMACQNSITHCPPFHHYDQSVADLIAHSSHFWIRRPFPQTYSPKVFFTCKGNNCLHQ